MTLLRQLLPSFVMLLVFAPVAGHAHFKMLEPAPSLVSNERGDPQKAFPCGGDAKGPGMPSGIVNKAVGGSKVHLKITETVYHPGHYRVALAVNSRDELPEDPVTTTRDSEKGPWSTWAVIQSPGQKPVLADGLFPHYVRPASPQTWETDIDLPNISCKKCTLQVIQFMAEHAYNKPGGYSYHQCADFEITADPSKPLSTGWPAQQ
jgi:hypothetical protein